MMARLDQLTIFKTCEILFVKSKASSGIATRVLKEGKDENKKGDPALSSTKRSECRKNVDEGLLVTRVAVSLRVVSLSQQAASGF